MIIYRAGKQIADIWVGAASYTLEEINGARIAYVEFTTLQPIGLTVNDSITYKGETYYVRHREDVTKEEVSRGFAYRVKLYHEMYRLHDVVAFPYEKPDFRKNMSKYNGTASQLLDIVVRSMNRVHAGWKAGSCVETKAETFDLKDKTCAEVVRDGPCGGGRAPDISRYPPGFTPKTDLKPKTRRGLRQKSIWSPKPAEDCAKNRFEARNPPRIAPKIDLEPKTRRGLHQKPIWSPKPAEDCAKNRFEAQNPPRIAPKIDLEPEMTLRLG